MTRTFVVLLLGALACAGCTTRASGDGEPVVTVRAPDIRAGDAASRTLEPLVTPAPTPTPPPTPSPTPAPTPPPLSAPRGATITSQAGTQQGAVQAFTWSSGSGPGEHHGGEDPPSEPILVRQGEVTLLTIDADRAPDEEQIRPFQGTREGAPTTRVAPALTVELTVDLGTGDWSMDVCATWHGHGQPVCWVFRLTVEPAEGA